MPSPKLLHYIVMMDIFSTTNENFLKPCAKIRIKFLFQRTNEKLIMRSFFVNKRSDYDLMTRQNPFDTGSMSSKMPSRHQAKPCASVSQLLTIDQKMVLHIALLSRRDFSALTVSASVLSTFPGLPEGGSIEVSNLFYIANFFGGGFFYGHVPYVAAASFLLFIFYLRRSWLGTLVFRFRFFSLSRWWHRKKWSFIDECARVCVGASVWHVCDFLIGRKKYLLEGIIFFDERFQETLYLCIWWFQKMRFPGLFI